VGAVTVELAVAISELAARAGRFKGPQCAEP
jgi:hypothetical protein